MKINHTGDYVARRAAEYPAVEEQLDMLWHAMDSGVSTVLEPFYSEIKRVKELYPKPNAPVSK